ncbi:hypothetical protein EJB05_04459, partial [Eragrostis curvula]
MESSPGEGELVGRDGGEPDSAVDAAIELFMWQSIQKIGSSTEGGVEEVSIFARMGSIDFKGWIQCWLSGNAMANNNVLPSMIQSISHGPSEMRNQCRCSNTVHTPDYLMHLSHDQMEDLKPLEQLHPCNDSVQIKLIKGEPGWSRTSLLATFLLSTFDKFRSLIYTRSTAEIIYLVKGMNAAGLPDTQLNELCESVIILERECDLGAFGYLSLEGRERLAKKYLGSPGPRFFANVVLQVLDQYKAFHKYYRAAAKDKLFLDIFKNEFVQSTNELKKCITYLSSRVDGFDRKVAAEVVHALESMDELLNHPDLDDAYVKEALKMNSKVAAEVVHALESMDELLNHPDLDDAYVKEAFGIESDENSNPSSISLAVSEELKQRKHDVAKKLSEMRHSCAEILKQFKTSLRSFPQAVKTDDDVKAYCVRTSKLILCSKGSSYQLNEISEHQTQCLIIEDADLFNEAEALVPLSIPSIKSMVLVGGHGNSCTIKGAQEFDFASTLLHRLQYLEYQVDLFVKHRDSPKSPAEQQGRDALNLLWKVLRIEFSWIGRPSNTKFILGLVRDQGNEDTCTLHTSMSTTESLLKFSYASRDPPQDFTIFLDLQDMKDKYKLEYEYEFGKEPTGKRGWERMIAALNILKKYGIRGTANAGVEKAEECVIKIKSFEEIKPEDVARVCKHLRDGQVLAGSILLSYNFFELKPDEVYKFDPERPVISYGGVVMKHAVMMVGYGQISDVDDSTNDAIHLVYQNSFGKLFGFAGGYGRVDIASVYKMAVV